MNQEWNLSTRNDPFSYYAHYIFHYIFRYNFHYIFHYILFSCELGPWRVFPKTQISLNATVLAWDRAQIRRAAVACTRAWSPQKEGRASQTACDHSSNSVLEYQNTVTAIQPVAKFFL